MPKKTTNETAPQTAPQTASPDLLNKSVVDESTLNQIIKRMEEQDAKISELVKENQRLIYAADKSRLAAFDSRIKTEKSKMTKLRKYNGKIVLGWSNLITNICEKNERGVWVENQKIKLKYADNSESEEIPLVIFGRGFEHVKAKIISEIKDNRGNIIYKVVTEDGREYEISDNFVN